MADLPLTPAISMDPLGHLPETPSQTAGPYVHIGLIPHQAGFEIFANALGHAMLGPDTPGERIRIEGRVFDGLGDPCRDILLEIWQADAAGRYNSPNDPRASPSGATPGATSGPGFRGWGRTGTDFETGLYAFDTIKPGAVPGRHGRPMAPHVSVWFVARGMNIGLSTRLYFGDEAAANAADPVLNLVEPSRRPTLIARREDRAEGVAYVFDIRLQGPGETVFFDV